MRLETEPRAGHDADRAWRCTLEFLRASAAGDVATARLAVDSAIETEGLGAANGALADACRALMDRIEFPPGTIDVLEEIDLIAERVGDLGAPGGASDRDRLSNLLVFLGSEGLPCAARTEVASWSPAERRDVLCTMAAGLLAFVSLARDEPAVDVAAALEPPGEPKRPLGTFTLVWRGPDGRAAPLRGVIPPSHTARITFLGTGSCTLRGIFARVAYLREPRPGTAKPRQSTPPPDYMRR